MSKVLICLACLVVSNFVYQEFFGDENYRQALEISFHQATALFIYYFIWSKN